MFNFIDRFVIFFYLIQNYFCLKIIFLVDFSLSWALLCSAGIDSWLKYSQFFDVELPASIQNLYFDFWSQSHEKLDKNPNSIK